MRFPPDLPGGRERDDVSSNDERQSGRAAPLRKHLLIPPLAGRRRLCVTPALRDDHTIDAPDGTRSREAICYAATIRRARAAQAAAFGLMATPAPPARLRASKTSLAFRIGPWVLWYWRFDALIEDRHFTHFSTQEAIDAIESGAPESTCQIGRAHV